jgi:hypothetical protein
MITLYIKDPIPYPKGDEEDRVKDRVSSGNVAWDIAGNYARTKQVISVSMINKVETIIILPKEEYERLKTILPEKLKTWIFKETK